jgi:hypothetical protein
MTSLSADSYGDRFWAAFGPILFGAPRAPQTSEEWIAAGKQLRALTQLDQLATRLEAASTQPQRPAARPAQRGKTGEEGSIYYDGEGRACCPIHEKPLKEGRWGYYCSCKDERGKNGYCDFKTKEV